VTVARMLARTSRLMLDTTFFPSHDSLEANVLALLDQRRGRRSALFYLPYLNGRPLPNLRFLSRTTLGLRPPPGYGSDGVVRIPRGAPKPQVNGLYGLPCLPSLATPLCHY